MNCYAVIKAHTAVSCDTFAYANVNNANIVLAFSSFKVGNLFSVKDPIPNGIMCGDHVWLINFRVQAVQLAMSVRPPDISTHV